MIFALVLVVCVGLVVLDRVVARRVGRRPRFGFQGSLALGNAFQQLQMIAQPRVENVIVQIMDEDDAVDEDSGDPEHPEAVRRSLLRQAERIRRGTLDGPVKTRVDAPAWRVRRRGGAWMRRFGLAMCVWVGVAAMAIAQSAGPASAVGDWQGTLKTPGGDLRLVLHVTQAADGTWGATLDSVDQGVEGIPASAVTVTGNQVKVEIAAAHATYEGTLSADGSGLKGTWTQGQSMVLDFARKAPVAAAVAAVPVMPSDIDGVWAGTLDAGLMKLRLVFHVMTTAQGLTATMDSPDQGAKGIRASSVTRDGDTFKLEIAAAHGSFMGTISKDRSTISGTWTQGGELPLVLTAVKDDAAKKQAEGERVRPQNPKRPYPYKEEEVSYLNKAQGDTLAGTLTIPQGNGPFPAVLLITGSGPQDRDEALLGHRPFLVLSDYLTRRGIEVLRVDDRGIGQSTGTFATATTADFATDVEAGVAFLKARPEVNPAKIGLIGHSEGGIIAPMVAARNKDVGFIVLMSGSGVPGYQVILEQAKRIEEAMGVPKEKAEAEEAQHREDYELILKHQDMSEADLRKLLKEKVAKDGVPDAEADALVNQVTGAWFRYFLAYDPRPALRQLRIPVLALIGAKDLQVLPDQNLPALREALKDDPKAEVVELPGLNHLYQTTKTGLPTEYQQLDETIAPVALKTIGDWVVKQ